MSMTEVENKAPGPAGEPKTDGITEKPVVEKPPQKMSFAQRLKNSFARFTSKGNKGKEEKPKEEKPKVVKQNSHDSIVRKPSEKSSPTAADIKKTKSVDDADAETAPAAPEIKETETEKHELLFSGTPEECQKLIESDEPESGDEKEPANVAAPEEVKDEEEAVEKTEESPAVEPKPEDSAIEESKEEEQKVEEGT